MAEPLEEFFSFDPDEVAKQQTTTPDGVTETFQRGFTAGLEGIATDADYFKGLLNTAVGDEEAAALNIAAARERETQNANQFGELENFEEFVENPTFDGFTSQVVKNVGQVTPYLFTTIGGGLGGAAVTGLAKLGLSATSRSTVKRIVKDSYEKKLKGTATPEEERVLATAYRMAQKNSLGDKLTLRGGATAGMFGQEYTSMAGSNFGESLDYVDQDEAALRAAGLAIPQALIGVKGEQLLARALMGDLKTIATRRATKEGSLFADLATTISKNTLRGGATEGTAEFLQEGLGAANRASIDEEYTKQDAAMRLAESTFAGFFGGAGISGAGSVATGSLRGAGAIMQKAKGYVEDARQIQIDNIIDQEQYGTDDLGFTSPEPEAAINAQLNAATDPNTARHSVWVAGSQPVYNAKPIDSGAPTLLEVNGEDFYAYFVPGRGTILSKNLNIAEEVAKSQASEASLASALQYSETKPADADLVVEALDENGAVVWQQATNEQGIQAAFAAAQKQVPERGTVRRLTLKEALENRNKQRGPTVRNMELDADNMFDMQMAAMEPIEPVNIGRVQNYKPRSEGKVYKDTDVARQEFSEAFNDVEFLGKDESTPVDFSNPTFAALPDTLLKAAVTQKTNNPNADIYIEETEAGFQLLRMPKEGEQRYRDSRQGEQDDADLPDKATFLQQAIARAAASEFARKNRGSGPDAVNGWVMKDEDEIVRVDGRAVNLTDLVKEGQRILSNETDTNFQRGGVSFSQRQGFIEIMAALLDGGYNVTIAGLEINKPLLTEINVLIDAIAQEEAAVADALTEFYGATGNDALTGFLGSTGAAPRTDRLLLRLEREQAAGLPLQRFAQERRAFNRAYRKAMLEGQDKPNIPRSSLLKIIDIPAGFKDGKPISLGQILLARSDETKPSDATYESEAFNADGVKQTVTGTRQQILERIEEEPDLDWQIFQPEVRRADGEVTRARTEITEEQLRDDMPTQGFEQPLMQRNNVKEDEEGYEAVQEVDPSLTEVMPQSWAQPGRGAPKKTVFGLANDSVAAKIVNNARRKLRLKKAVSIFNVGSLLSDDPEVLSQFSDPRVAEFVKQEALRLREETGTKGKYLGFADAHIILVDPENETNQLETALVVGHELGHALFNEQLNSTLKNEPLYDRLFKAFEEARDVKGSPAAYQGNQGFEEWYADQTAYWAQKLYLTTTPSRADKAKAYKRPTKGASGKSASKLPDKVKPAKGVVKAHFKKLAKQLKAWHEQLSRDIRARIGAKSYSDDFDTYMGEVLRLARSNLSDNFNKSGALEARWEKKALVRKMAEVIEKESPGFAGKMQEQVKKIIRSDGFTPIYNLIFTADSRLRKIAGDVLADMMYARAQDSKGKGATRLGFIKAAALEGNAWFSKLEDMIDGDIDSDEVRADIEKAFGDEKTEDLEGNAKQVRLWFERFYDEYIEPSNTDIERRENYAPVVLKLSEIERNPEGLLNLILEAEPDANVASVKAAIDKLVGFQHMVMDEVPVAIKETNPAFSVEKAIQLTKQVPRERLKEAGFLEDSDVALLRYANHIVKRVEWNRHTKDADGNDLYKAELEKLSPRERAEAEKIVQKYLGYNTSPLSPMWRTINSWGSVLQIFAILPLATLGSLPELAGPVIASKEFGALAVGMKEVLNTIRNRDEARLLARDLGVVTSQSVANAMMSQSELEWMDQSARKLTDGFFRVTLLDTYTKFTREFASNMGVRFLMKHSNADTSGPDSTRYLQELGVTAEEVKAWSDNNQDFSSPEGQKVRLALQRFVESSTLRPNAAERPLWASDPHWALFWQLKGFFYAYGKVMLAGAKREAQARLAGVGTQGVSNYAALSGAAGVFALMGIATMPLAMVGMELREYAKYGLAWAIPGIDHEAKNYFRTDDLTWPQYLSAAFDRSFAAGPVTIASQAMQAADWGRGVTGAAAVVAGPTTETLTRIFTDGFGSTFENRMLPTGLL